MTSPTVAALFVEPGGVYYGHADVDPWDQGRDARLYAGPWPVVAHPPCARWSRLAGFTEARFGYRRGQDYGCFQAALEAVRTWGGVLEHPAYSAAWPAFGLAEPVTYEGWTGSIDGGWSAYVEQGRYGLPAKKATWLYAYNVADLADLRWGFTPDSDGERPSGPWGGIDGWRDVWAHGRKRRTYETPVAFRDQLLAMARSAQRLAVYPA